MCIFGFSNKANHKSTSATAEALAKNMKALISLCEVEAGLGLCSSHQELSVPMKWYGRPQVGIKMIKMDIFRYFSINIICFDVY